MRQLRYHFARGELSRRQYDAGRRLAAGFDPETEEFTDDAALAIDALGEVGGDVADALIAVCLLEMSAKDYARTAGIREAAGVGVVRTYLDVLATYYERIGPPEPPPDEDRRPRDRRPSIPSPAEVAAAKGEGGKRILDRYLAARHINGRQWQAGDRLQREWLAEASEAPRQNGQSADQAPERSRCREVLEAVGPEHAQVLVAVCLWNEAAGNFALRRLGRSRSAGMAALEMALDALADAYGLPE